MRASDFEYQLPEELIAQHPAAQRDESRLLVLERASGKIVHRIFSQFPEYLRAGDVLVLNNSKVIPARLRGANARSRGGAFKLLLLSENATNDWWAMVRPGKRARPETQIQLFEAGGLPSNISATVLAVNDQGHRRLLFSGTSDIRNDLPRLGEIPLPPYIRRSGRNEQRDDLERYQTVYAQAAGSVAAPTAGLHFTAQLLHRISELGVQIRHVTLHVGLGTFAPVKTERLEEHTMHEEWYQLPHDTAEAVNAAKSAGGRVIAVGTTSVRVLESAGKSGELRAGAGRTNIFIHPPFQFQWVDILLTNFHLPRSTLLMLGSAFAAPGADDGREIILNAYQEAIRERYRFFSYGDAMLLL